MPLVTTRYLNRRLDETRATANKRLNLGGSGSGMDWTKVSFGYKLNPDGDDPDEVRIYAGEIDRVTVAQADITVANDNWVYVRRTLADDAMLVQAAASVPADSATYRYYRLYQFTVEDGVASIKTIARPFDIEGAGAGAGAGYSGTVTVISSFRYTGSLQYKTRALTYVDGVLTSVTAESDWVTLFTTTAGCPS